MWHCHTLVQGQRVKDSLVLRGLPTFPLHQALGLSDGKLLPPAGGLRAVQEGALKKTFTPLSLSPSSGPVSGCMSPLSSPWQSPVLPSSPIFIERDPVEGLPLFSDLPQVLPRKPPVPPASTLQASLLSASQTRPPSVFHSGRNSPTLMTRPAERLPSFDQLPEPGSLGRVPSALNYPLSPSLTHFGTGSLPYSNNQSQFLPDPVVPSNALSVAGRQTELPLPPNTLSTPYGSAPAALPGRTSFSLLHCAGLVSSSLASHSCSSVCAHNETQSHMGIDMRQAIADQLMKVLDDEVLPGQHANRDNSLSPFLSKSTSNAKMASPRSYDGPDPFWDSSDAFNKMDEQLSKVFLCDDETPVLSSIHGPVVPSRVPIAGLYPQHRYATISAPASIFGGA